MVAEVVTISPDFPTWERIEIFASIKHAACSLQLQLVDRPGAPIWPGIYPSGTLVTVAAGGDLMFTGYVDHREPKLSGHEYHIVIGARSKGQDVVDCSVDHTKPDYVQKTVLDVARDQDAFGVGFASDFSPTQFDRWRPNVGHTLFEALRPLVEDQGATMAGQPDGSIKITKAGASAQLQAGPIVEGQNLFEGEACFDDKATHSKVHAHGQSYKGNGTPAIAIHAEADNQYVGRYRPVHEHHDRQTDKPRITARATRRRDKEQGEGTRATVTMRGWRDSGGMIYQPGRLVFVQSPSLALTQNMLIEGVHYVQVGKSGGTSCRLSLVDPRAHGGQGGGVNQSGAAWNFDSSGAT